MNRNCRRSNSTAIKSDIKWVKVWNYSIVDRTKEWYSVFNTFQNCIAHSKWFCKLCRKQLPAGFYKHPDSVYFCTHCGNVPSYCGCKDNRSVKNDTKLKETYHKLGMKNA